MLNKIYQDKEENSVDEMLIGNKFLNTPLLYSHLLFWSCKLFMDHEIISKICEIE